MKKRKKFFFIFNWDCCVKSNLTQYFPSKEIDTLFYIEL